MPLSALQTIQTPAYVADIKRIKENLSVAARIKSETGCKILLATKAFSMFSVFPFMRDVLDGTTASGLFEARLGATHFGKDVHTYSPAFREKELRACLKYSSHIYFNSISQLKAFSPLVRTQGANTLIGLRINPGLSLVKNSALYDPSVPTSRFGIHTKELNAEVLDMVDILHFHNLCENMAEDSVKLIEHISKQFGKELQRIFSVNLGGGHYMTHPEYKLDLLIEALKTFQARFDVQTILEPGGALVYDAGYLVSEVIDIINRDQPQAILNASASTHMPDVLEVPYRPNIIGSGKAGEKPHTYILGGNTCMTGDVIGEYSFAEPLEIGQKLVFTDMMQYSFVKNTSFNGVPLPDFGILHEDGTYELIKRFGYEDFESRLS